MFIYRSCPGLQCRINFFLWVVKNAWAKNGKESKEEEFLRKEGDVEEKNYRRKKKVRKEEERVKVISLLEPPNPTLLKVPAPHTSAFPGRTWWTQGNTGRK